MTMKLVTPSMFRRALPGALVFAAAGVAHAAYPERPITIVVPYAPGGAADALARLVAQKMGAKLGTSVIAAEIDSIRLAAFAACRWVLRKLRLRPAPARRAPGAGSAG